jgi:2-amino-4-hydroxy-6-hydroxymethyldihydropteridine diphosphokinase
VPVKAWVALGSNLGDRDAALAFALRALVDLDEITALECSPVYETDPVGPGRQQHYLNAVACLETALSARALLAALLEIERRAGRVRDPGKQRFGPRCLDLDLLLFGERGEVRVDEPGLTVPHPRLSERAFVLVPLADVAPGLRVPGLGVTVEEMLQALCGPGRAAVPGVRPWERCRRIPR